MDENDFILVAERLYREINPESKMNVPSRVYEIFNEWYKEWISSRSTYTFYQWVLINKKK